MAFFKYAATPMIAWASEVANIEYVPESLNIDCADYGVKLIEELNSITPLRTDPSQFLYIRNHAISSLEEFGYNQNRDAWGVLELRSSYPTFIGAPVCANHNNMDPDAYYGFVPDTAFLWSKTAKEAWFEDEDYRKKYFTEYFDCHDKSAWVENVLVVDKALIEVDYPGLVEKIANKEILGTSMGVLSGHSICSKCGNKARNPDEYCEHISLLRDYSTAMDENTFEINYDNTFFEDSIITTNTHADKNAVILTKYAHVLKIADTDLDNPALVNSAIAKRRNAVVNPALPWIKVSNKILTEEKEIEGYCKANFAPEETDDEKTAVEENMVGGRPKGYYDFGTRDKEKDIAKREKTRADFLSLIWDNRPGKKASLMFEDLAENARTVEKLLEEQRVIYSDYLEEGPVFLNSTDLSRPPKSVRDNSEALEVEEDDVDFSDALADYDPAIKWTDEPEAPASEPSLALEEPEEGMPKEIPKSEEEVE